MSESLPQTNPTGSLPYRRGLHAFAVLLVLLTFALIVLGGTVTSHVAGMSVPNWPRSFSYSMVGLPLSWWTGGVLYEHTHRLLGSLVGAVSLVLMLWLWFTQARRPWVRGLGLVILGLVILQGVLGGLRVNNTSIVLAIIHGVLGQIFLCSTVLAAAANSRQWLEKSANAEETRVAPAPAGARQANPALLRLLALALLGALVVQLTLGAGMRHTGSGLAIPDFPTSLGRVFPPMDQQAIDQASASFPRPTLYATDSNGQPVSWIPTTGQVGIAFSHRLGALVVLGLGLWLIAVAARSSVTDRRLTRPALGLLVLLLLQVTLGALVIWTGRHPEITTAHQATGAAILALVFLLTARIYRFGPAVTSLRGGKPARVGPAALEGSLA